MTKKKLEMRITDTPDCQVSFDRNARAMFGISSSGQFDNECLVFLTEMFFPEWQKYRWSLHELDWYLA